MAVVYQFAFIVGISVRILESCISIGLVFGGFSLYLNYLFDYFIGVLVVSWQHDFTHDLINFVSWFCVPLDPRHCLMCFASLVAFVYSGILEYVQALRGFTNVDLSHE